MKNVIKTVAISTIVVFIVLGVIIGINQGDNIKEIINNQKSIVVNQIFVRSNLDVIYSELKKTNERLDDLNSEDRLLYYEVDSLNSKVYNILIEKIVEAENIEKIINSSVIVSTEFGFGAGTVVEKTEDSMLILTAFHVVAPNVDENDKVTPVGVTRVNISENPKDISECMYSADIIKFDRKVDLALLKVYDNDKYLNVISLAKSVPKIGEVIYTIGNPIGLIRTVSKGILSNYILREDNIFFLTDGTMTWGNSGGGLFNEDAELIGVPDQLSEIYDLNGSLSPETGLGLSVDLKTIKKFLEEEI